MVYKVPNCRWLIWSESCWMWNQKEPAAKTNVWERGETREERKQEMPQGDRWISTSFNRIIDKMNNLASNWLSYIPPRSLAPSSRQLPPPLPPVWLSENQLKQHQSLLSSKLASSPCSGKKSLCCDLESSWLSADTHQRFTENETYKHHFFFITTEEFVLVSWWKKQVKNKFDTHIFHKIICDNTCTE